MEMFNKKFKLIATMVGLVGVLAMMLAVPGATQGSFSRQALVNTLKSEISALLTAGVGETVDLDAAAFFSSRRATSAYIPPHFSALPGQLIKDYLRGKAEWIFLGAVYISEDVLQVLPKGLYYLKAINRERVALINQEGEVIGTRWIKWLREPDEAASLYESYSDGAYFVLTARTGGDPGTQYVFDGGGGGSPGTPGSPPPPPSNPPDPEDDKLSWTITIGVCAPIPIIQACITFAEIHI
jgi:hypothetical protein